MGVMTAAWCRTAALIACVAVIGATAGCLRWRPPDERDVLVTAPLGAAPLVIERWALREPTGGHPNRRYEFESAAVVVIGESVSSIDGEERSCLSGRVGSGLLLAVCDGAQTPRLSEVTSLAEVIWDQASQRLVVERLTRAVSRRSPWWTFDGRMSEWTGDRSGGNLLRRVEIQQHDAGWLVEDSLAPRKSTVNSRPRTWEFPSNGVSWPTLPRQSWLDLRRIAINDSDRMTEADPKSVGNLAGSLLFATACHLRGGKDSVEVQGFLLIGSVTHLASGTAVLADLVALLPRVSQGASPGRSARVSAEIGTVPVSGATDEGKAEDAPFPFVVVRGVAQPGIPSQFKFTSEDSLLFPFELSVIAGHEKLVVVGQESPVPPRTKPLRAETKLAEIALNPPIPGRELESK